MKGPWHRLSRVHRDILIFTSSALKTWVLHVNTFYSWILLYISPLTYLYFPYHCISLIYFSFTMIRMFLYAQIYWLAEFGDVSCLQFNYLRVETLTTTWEDLVGQFGRTFVGVKSDKTLCPTWVFDRWYTWRDLYHFRLLHWYLQLFFLQ